MTIETTPFDETVSRLLTPFTKGPHPQAIRSELTRFFWNQMAFADALPLKEAEPLLRAQNAGHFLYHQASGLVFTSMMFGRHQLVMAYIEALHKTDFSKPIQPAKRTPPIAGRSRSEPTARAARLGGGELASLG